ncbi:MAG: pyridoxamine 5'-phosphate oxidase [Micavibrio aeruginosavorus]|nr:pyridoxamine 5'-phosphate oxidase [Micavibrio aeruginosavorus]
MDIFAALENVAQTPQNPLVLFDQWLSEAEKTEPNDPNAMGLATVDARGRPSLRIVLLKGYDERGFVFYTNRESRKGGDLAAHAVAALCLHWKSLKRQVRIEGTVVPVSDAESDDYYASRPLGSRIGAWASQQSRPLESRSALTARVEAVERRFADNPDIPRPPHWGGYRVIPQSIEFWHDGESRLHTRVLYEKTADGWARHMLYP